MERIKGWVLVVDDDDGIAELVEEVLLDDGYEVTILRDGRLATIEDTVTRVKPDCILLDGGEGTGYGDSWESAAVLATRVPPVPVIMFTAHSAEATEAHRNISERSQAAGFAAVLAKPFELSDLLAAVEQSVRTSQASEVR
jgi:CheY-like chemotaxis protein